MKAAFYMRVGNADQLMDENSRKQAIGFVYDSLGRKEYLEEQKKKMQQYCSNMGLNLKTIYECSKKDLKDRKAYFNSIIRENAADVDTFIIPSVSQISMKFNEFREIMDNFREYGIKVLSLTVSENMLLNSKKPLQDLNERAASGEIGLSGRYVGKKYENYALGCEENFKAALKQKLPKR